MNNSTEIDRLKKFIKKVIGYNINEETVFFKDLKLVGDDASEFMSLFSKEFEVDISNFRFEDYFVDEYDISMTWFKKKEKRREMLKRLEFDISHFELIIINKRWIYPSLSGM